MTDFFATDNEEERERGGGGGERGGKREEREREREREGGGEREAFLFADICTAVAARGAVLENPFLCLSLHTSLCQGE